MSENLSVFLNVIWCDITQFRTNGLFLASILQNQFSSDGADQASPEAGGSWPECVVSLFDRHHGRVEHGNPAMRYKTRKNVTG